MTKYMAQKAVSRRAVKDSANGAVFWTIEDLFNMFDDRVYDEEVDWTSLRFWVEQPTSDLLLFRVEVTTEE